MARIGDVTQLLGPVALLVFAGYWLKGIASWPPPYLIIVWFVSFGLTGLSRRWALEDRVEALEQKLKKL